MPPYSFGLVSHFCTGFLCEVSTFSTSVLRGEESRSRWKEFCEKVAIVMKYLADFRGRWPGCFFATACIPPKAANPAAATPPATVTAAAAIVDGPTEARSAVCHVRLITHASTTDAAGQPCLGGTVTTVELDPPRTCCYGRCDARYVTVTTGIPEIAGWNESAPKVITR